MSQSAVLTGRATHRRYLRCPLRPRPTEATQLRTDSTFVLRRHVHTPLPAHHGGRVGDPCWWSGTISVRPLMEFSGGAEEVAVDGVGEPAAVLRGPPRELDGEEVMHFWAGERGEAF